MNALTYQEAYPRRLPHSVLNVQDEEIDLSKSRHWSHTFGELLHEGLEGKAPSDEVLMNLIESYSAWCETSIPHLRYVLGARKDDDEAARDYSNEINFHGLNAAMLPMWCALAESVTNKDGEAPWRRKAITLSQEAIALSGLEYYVSREHVAGKDANYVYFDDANKYHRLSFEGQANEYDAAIVLLEMMKRRKELVVVPAPLQFEKYTKAKDGKSANVDFVFISSDERAGGVQVKGFVDAAVADKYDKSRVVLLDAANDMGNERVMRTNAKNSHVRKVSWAGLICAQRVTTIQTQGRNVPLRADNGNLMRKKFRAKQLTRGIKSYLPIATDRITERIDNFLKKAETA